MDIININGQYGVYSWTQGFVFKNQKSPMEEASENRINACAVIARLMHEKRWDEAEEIMDKFL